MLGCERRIVRVAAALKHADAPHALALLRARDAWPVRPPRRLQVQ